MVCAVSSYPNLAQHAHWWELDNILSMILFSILPKKSSALFSCLLLYIYLTWYSLTCIACSFITSCCYYYLRGKMTSSTNKSNASMTKVNLEEPPTLSRRLVQLPIAIQACTHIQLTFDQQSWCRQKYPRRCDPDKNEIRLYPSAPATHILCERRWS